MNLSPYLDLRINQELDRNLIPCPVCHNEYNDPNKGRCGPTCLPKFEGDKVHILCLNCWTKSKPFKKQDDAIKGWNSGDVIKKEKIGPHQARRMRLGLTQREVGLLAHVNHNSVSKIENGLSGVSKKTRIAVEQVLGMI